MPAPYHYSLASTVAGLSTALSPGPKDPKPIARKKIIALDQTVRRRGREGRELQFPIMDSADFAVLWAVAGGDDADHFGLNGDKANNRCRDTGQAAFDVRGDDLDDLGQGLGHRRSPLLRCYPLGREASSLSRGREDGGFTPPHLISPRGNQMPPVGYLGTDEAKVLGKL